MNLTELSQQLAEQFRSQERAAPAVYACGAHRDADLVSYALTALFTDAGIAEQVDRARWTQRRAS